MYHWYSKFTGELVEDFSKLIPEIVCTVRLYRRSWTLFDIASFVCSWEYSKKGF